MSLCWRRWRSSFRQFSANSADFLCVLSGQKLLPQRAQRTAPEDAEKIRPSYSGRPVLKMHCEQRMPLLLCSFAINSCNELENA